MASPRANLAAVVVVTSYLVYAVASSSRVRRQVVGTAGVDYPTYSEVPPGLSFACTDKIPGYYADPEAQCQVWHWCVPGGQKYSFLCPNQTLFNQVHRVCDWWYNVDCSASPDKYNINEDLYIVPDSASSSGRSLDAATNTTATEEDSASAAQAQQTVADAAAVEGEEQL
ncbi:U-scoloptoxin(01)-Er1a-like [Macrobrachium nipponense]|uniref:U-scoloptoxin(01)-Er1a-like n=1 Tax=Macrobrachium nipponense TaxID=159736 RepID=UPI0030C88D51